MTNRNKCKQYLLTFPRWEDTALISFKSVVPPYEYLKVCEEEHDDPDSDVKRGSMVHYHVVVILKHPIAKTTLLKWLGKKYPNDWKRVDVQGIKNLKSSLSYLSKESTKVIEDGVEPSRAEPSRADEAKLNKKISEVIGQDFYEKLVIKEDKLYLYEVLKSEPDVFINNIGMAIHKMTNEDIRQACEQLDWYYGNDRLARGHIIKDK